MSMNDENQTIWRQAASAMDNCPSLEELHQILESGRREGASAAHVDGCPHCQAELAMLRSFLSPEPVDNEREAIAWITGRLQPSADRQETSPQSPVWRGFWKLPYFAGTAAAALAVGLVVLGISLYVSRQPQQPALNAKLSENQILRSVSVHLSSPSGSLVRVPEKFEWDAFPGAKSYSIELQEVDGSVLWKGYSLGNFMAVSPDLKSKIRADKPFLWQVRALDSSGSIIATSNRERFAIRPSASVGNK